MNIESEHHGWRSVEMDEWRMAFRPQRMKPLTDEKRLLKNTVTLKSGGNI